MTINRFWSSCFTGEFWIITLFLSRLLAIHFVNRCKQGAPISCTNDGWKNGSIPPIPKINLHPLENPPKCGQPGCGEIPRNKLKVKSGGFSYCCWRMNNKSPIELGVICSSQWCQAARNILLPKKNWFSDVISCRTACSGESPINIYKKAPALAEFIRPRRIPQHVSEVGLRGYTTDRFFKFSIVVNFLCFIW